MSNLDHNALCRMVTAVLERTMFIFAEPAQPGPADSKWASSISFSGAYNGSVTVRASEGFVRQLVGGFVSVEPQQADLAKFGQDAMNELANLVGGQIVAALGGEDRPIRLGLPDPAKAGQTKLDKALVCGLDSMGDQLTIVYSGDGLAVAA
jgi:CheY-specific phosphatase CheX